jgi:hypothetical protein
MTETVEAKQRALSVAPGGFGANGFALGRIAGIELVEPEHLVGLLERASVLRWLMLLPDSALRHFGDGLPRGSAPAT